jgi:hypothetical protein
MYLRSKAPPIINYSCTEFRHIKCWYVRSIEDVPHQSCATCDNFPDATIFRYHYEAMLPLKTELLRHVMHPRNLSRIAGIL